MSDLHARERHDSTWGRPVADLIEEGEVVGLAYEDEGEVLVEFYPDPDGEPRLYDVADLQRSLDTVLAMFGAEPAPGVVGAAPAEAAEEHPVDALAAQFDARATRRGPEDEGFYPLEVAASIVNRCSDLSLAVVSLEGFTLHSERETPVSGCSADLGAIYRGEPWAVLMAGCNLQALALLERWPRRAGFGVTLEVQDAGGEVFVL